MIVKTPGSQMGSAAEGGGEARGGGRVNREVECRWVDVEVDSAKSEIKFERWCKPG